MTEARTSAQMTANLTISKHMVTVGISLEGFWSRWTFTRISSCKNYGAGKVIEFNLLAYPVE